MAFPTLALPEFFPRGAHKVTLANHFNSLGALSRNFFASSLVAKTSFRGTAPRARRACLGLPKERSSGAEKQTLSSKEEPAS
jgi:hypothetical protein